MTINQIRRFTMSDRADSTLRIQLNKLIKLGLVSKRRNTLYNCAMYKPRSDLFPNDPTILAMVEGADLKSESCYLTASIINKVRHMAKEQHLTHFNFSASEIKELIHTDKSRGTIRLALRKLEKQNYFNSKKNGRRLEYEINSVKLEGFRTPEVLTAEAEELASLFGVIQETVFGYPVKSSQITSLKRNFKGMLENGYDSVTLRHILGYLAIKKESAHMSPGKLKSNYDRLYVESYRNISRKRVSKYLWKLVNGHIIPKSSSDKVCKPAPNSAALPLSSQAIGNMAVEWCQKNQGMLWTWYRVMSYGVAGSDFEDFRQEAMLIITKNLMDGMDVDHKHFVSTVKYGLQTAMHRQRSTIENAKDSENGHKKSIVHHMSWHDLDERYMSDNEESEVSEKYRQLASDVISKLKELTKDEPWLFDLVKGIYGVDGKLTYKEASQKYGLAESTLHGRVQVLIKKLRKLKPPG